MQGKLQISDKKISDGSGHELRETLTTKDTTVLF